MGVVDHTIYPKSTGLLLVAGGMAFVAGIFLIMSFASPYWLVSWQATFSEFKNLGLWEFCFENFRFPKYQFDKAFHGCHHAYSEEYLVVREWLMPGWFMFVQAMMCLALIFGLLCQISISIVVMRFMLRWEWIVLTVALVMAAMTAFPIALAVIVFGAKCWDRTWLMYPNWNYPSWGFVLANVACLIYIIVAFVLQKEIVQAKERKRMANNLVYRAEPSSGDYRY